MEPTDSSRFRLLWLVEMDRLNERLQEFGAEVRRQEDGLRALYPWLAKAFRREAKPVPGPTTTGRPCTERQHVRPQLQ